MHMVFYVYFTLVLQYEIVIPTVVRINTYSWGSNSNVTLGHEMSKQYPQKLKMLTNYGIKQVCYV